MAKFKISGIWTDDKGVITHYAFHKVEGTTLYKGRKTAKADAIKLLNDPANEAVTWLWDYNRPGWKDGAKVEVVNGQYLRSYHDNKVSDNLAHLIDYDWLQ